MSKISAEYKEIMEREKNIIKKMGDKIVDAYEDNGFLVIVSISKNHIIWQSVYFKRFDLWERKLMVEQD